MTEATTNKSSSDDALSLALMNKLLSDNTYDIEFHGFLSNHVKHAIIALDGLNASSDRIQEYWDEYTTETPYGLKLHHVDKPWDEVAVQVTATTTTPEDFLAWRGKKIHWQEQVMFLQHQLQNEMNGDVYKLVQAYAPDLLETGLVGSLLHGIIHLGWAIDSSKSDYAIVEGLAYLNFGHIGVNPQQLHFSAHDDDTSSPIDSFLRVANTVVDQDLQSTWIDRVKSKYDTSFHPELVSSGLQWQIAKLAYEPHDVATNLPTWIDTAAAAADDDEDDEEEESTWMKLYQAVVYMFLATRDSQGHGNFVVLHLLTSLWALERVCLNLKKNDTTGKYPEWRRKAWGQFYATAIVVLCAAAGFIPPKALEDAKQDIRPDATSAGYDWEPIVEKAVAEVEEHNIKLVYVARELWKRFGHWKGFSEAANAFTLTPQIGGGGFNTNKSK